MLHVCIKIIIIILDLDLKSQKYHIKKYLSDLVKYNQFEIKKRHALWLHKKIIILDLGLFSRLLPAQIFQKHE